MFLLVPANPSSPGQKAVKRLCVCVLSQKDAATATPPQVTGTENYVRYGHVKKVKVVHTRLLSVGFRS